MPFTGKEHEYANSLVQQLDATNALVSTAYDREWSKAKCREDFIFRNINKDAWINIKNAIKGFTADGSFFIQKETENHITVLPYIELR